MKKGFALGLATGVVLTGASLVLANSQIQAILNDQIKVTLNGQVQEFRDETTNEIQYPITYHDRTYLPLRTVANLVDVNVDYDASSNTAILTSDLGSKNANTVLVPDVRKFNTLDDAKEEIVQRKLEFKTEYKYNKDIPSGDVITQIPASNSIVIPGSIVTVYISKGVQPGLIYVPNVIGETEENGIKKLTDIGLLPDIKAVTDLNYEDGVIINQTPSPDEIVSELSTVAISINRLNNDSSKINNTDKRAISIDLSNKGQQDEFNVKVTLDNKEIGTLVEYEAKHSKKDGIINVYVSDIPGAYLKLYIDDKLDSEQILK